MQDSPLVVLYDATGNAIGPATGKPATALSTNQGGVLALGSDYATTPKAQAPKVDANGLVATLPATATTAGTALASASSAVGTLQMGLQSLTPTPVQVDSVGNFLCAPTNLPSFSCVASAVATASGKSTLALLNKSTSSVVRLVGVYAQNSGTAPSTLSTYNIYAQELRFFTAMTGGTAVSAIGFDTADSLPSGITFMTGATISGEISPPLRRWISSTYPLAPGATAAEDTTADQQGREPWYLRPDVNAKTITIRPGYGLHLKIASTAQNGFLDVTFVFTVASA